MKSVWGHFGGLLSRAALILAATLAAAVSPAVAAAAPVTFSASTNYASGTFPTAIAVLDIGGDGHRDLAAANTHSTDVTVLTGSGSGAFSTLGNIAGFSAPSAIAIADFNEDGRQDMAVANGGSSGTNGVRIEFGSAMGFSSTTGTASTHAGPSAIAAGDFNGDGHQDLAVGNGSSNDVSVLLGSGTGSFSAPTNFLVDSSPSSIAVGDFNRDGKQDLVSANTGSFSTASKDDVSVLIGDGAGSFAPATNFPAGTRPSAVAVGDFNADGRQDLAVSDFNGDGVSVLLGTGTGTFSARTDFPAGNTPSGVTTGDFNGDGKQDLAVSDFNGDGVSVLLGTGTGSFSAPADFAVNTFDPHAIAAGDFNGDGREDLAVADGSNEVSVLLNTSHFPVVSQLASPNGCLTFAAVAGCGSLAGSGFSPEDVAVSPETSGSVSSVYLGSPNGVVVLSRIPATGALSQQAGPGSLRGLAGAAAAVDGKVTVSPDGKSVYLATGHALLAFSRNTSTGALTQLPGTAGCINGNGDEGCATSRFGTDFVPDLVRFGPEADGSSVYVLTSPNNNGTALSLFTRDTTTGALSQSTGTAGCINATGSDGHGGSCQQVAELDDQTDISFTADGALAYVASHSSETIVAFSRDTGTGALTPLAGSSRCVVDADATEPSCRPARALSGIQRTVVVGDNLYVTSTNGTDHGVAEFAISPVTGALSQLEGATGCLTTTGHDGEASPGACTQARVTGGAGDLGQPHALVASPDGLDVYVESETNGDITTLARDLSTGALSDTACVGDNTVDSGCTQGTGMSDLSGLAISPDGKSLYASSSNGVSAFSRRPLGFTVTGNANPAGGGSVAASSSSANSSCAGSSCTVDSGSSGTLTASAASGYRFTGWTGACAGATNPCTLDNVTADSTATANFVQRFTVTGSASPGAGGSIVASSSSPSPSCSGASCTVDSGSSVDLNATPASGYRFTGWSGACAGGPTGRTCTLTNVTANTTATANFVRRVTVTGAPSPAAGGDVDASSSSANAICDSPTRGVCTVDSGDPVTLTATPRSGYKFTGWSGACSGATNPCTLVDVTADTAATANFSALPPAGTTSTGGSSTTTASPSGTFKTGISVLCGGKPCVLVAGAKVTLPAKLVKLARGKAAKKKTITVGTYSHKLGAGKHKALVIRLNSKGRALLKRLHKLPVRVDVRLSAPNERTVRTHRTLKVKAPSKHH